MWNLTLCVMVAVNFACGNILAGTVCLSALWLRILARQ